jgi:hypothetical protein
VSSFVDTTTVRERWGSTCGERVKHLDLHLGSRV